MSLLARIIRLLFVFALAIYLGGFTFYSVVVIPILHDQLGSSLEAGLVTQRVTKVLNEIGVVTLLLGWRVYRDSRVAGVGGDRGHAWRLGPILVSTTCLLGLFALHSVLDRKLEAGTRVGFYPWHRAYLWTSTIQWVANIVLMAQAVGFTVPRAEPDRPSR
jgi:hypothetical protein